MSEPSSEANTANPAPAVDPRLLDILVCPVTRTGLVLRANGHELWCRGSGLAYPVRDGIPVLLESEARELTAEERSGAG